MSAAVFRATSLSFRYPRSDRAAVDGIDLAVDPGELLAVLGPNGSGKSTLLRLLLGALLPDAGTVQHRDRPVAAWPRAELARAVGVVTQAEDLTFPLTVRELVAMGRYPHLGAWRREGAADRAAIARAIERCGIADLAQRGTDELSGGERQLARVARALAQEPQTLLLDEPTAALDIAHEMALFELLAGLRDDGVTIVTITHNINVAARYADRLVLLDRGRIAASGLPAAVLTRAVIEAVYHWPVIIRTEEGAPQVVPLRRSGRDLLTTPDTPLREELP